MRIPRKIIILLIGLFAVLNVYGQKNITKPNVQGPNGVSVNTYTGGLFYQRQDLMIPGRGLSIDLTFTYNTVSRDRDWGFGKGWTFNYNMAYSFDSMDVVIEHMDGSRNRYLPNGSGGWYCPAGVFDSLEQYEPNKFRLTRKDGMRYFFDDTNYKKLSKVQDRNGNTIALTYTDSLLTTITDPSGRQVNLSWTAGRLTKITDPNTSPARTITFIYDVQGNPISVRDPLSNSTDYTYDNQYKLTAIVNKNGNAVNIVYNFLDAVREVISCVGKQTFTYNYENFKTYLVEDVGGAKQITTYEFNEAGQIVSQSGNCCGYNVKFEYDASNNITKRIDANGNATSFVYDGMGNVLQEVDPLGNAMVWTYEPQFNLMTSETDRNGNKTTYSYDAKGNLVQISKPLGVTGLYTFDAFGNQVAFTDGRGNSTTYSYDNFGNILSMLDPEGGLTTFNYDGVSNNTSFTLPNGHTTQVEFDLLNRATRFTNALGEQIEYTYDAESNETSFKDGNGNITIHTYDALNRLIETVNPLGNAYSYDYDERGNITKIKDAAGFSMKYVYNSLSRLEREINPLGEETFYEYDGVGNLVSLTQAGGNTLTLSYDIINRLQSINDLIGPIASYTYDNNSNRTSISDGNGNITKYFYDALNRNNKIEDPLGRAINFTFDQNDNLTQILDRKGDITNFTYDGLDRRIGSTDPLNNVTTYNYDANDNLISLTDANGNSTVYTYDAANRIISETYPDNQQRSFQYDAASNLIQRTEPNGNSINYSYDMANRLIGRTFPDASTESFTYDSKGRIISAINANATVLLTYDPIDRLTSETLNGNSTTYQYNTVGKTLKMTYPGGREIIENYDNRGRLSTILENSTQEILATIGYDPGNRLLSQAFLNNTSTSYDYDPNSNIISINHTLGSSPKRYEYAYNQNDNKLYEKNLFQTSNSSQFIYDAYNRLQQYKKGVLNGTNINAPSKDILYNYDGANNRNSQIINGTTTNYTSNNLNQYTALSGGISAALNYDENGSLLSDGQYTYQYDFENRLTSVDNGATSEYLYDALERRIAKIIGTDTTTYFYSYLRVIEERSSGGMVEATYVYGSEPDEVISMERLGSTYFYHVNALGSTTFLSDASGQIVEQYEYDAYGRVTFLDALNNILAGSALKNPVLFTGQRYDEEIGLYFYKARHYSPELGRFIQRDPLDYADGPSLYEYAFSNPTNWLDPLGLSGSPCDKPWWEDCVVGGALGALGGLLTGGPVGALAGGVIGCASSTIFGTNPLDDIRNGDYWGAAINVGLNFIPGGVGGKFAKAGQKALGPLKQWVRVGPSYSKALGQSIGKSIRWGASPAKNGKYIKQIPSKSMQNLNQWLRGKKLPFGGWRSADPGHFHIKK